MKDQYREHACDLKNEDECEEELDEDVLPYEEVEEKHFKPIDGE